MAIQLRRGAYTNFNPSKLLPGEFAVVQNNDPSGSGGLAVYMCFGSGVVERLALMDDVDGALSAFTVDWDDVTNKPVADTSLSVSGAYADAQAVGNVLTGDLASEYDSSSAYAVGDYCIYQKQLYRCATAISSGGETWNSSHWTSIKALPEMVRYVNAVVSQISTDWPDITGKPPINKGSKDTSIVENDVSGNTASGNYSRASGNGTRASGTSSDASNYQTVASGQYSHAEGAGTIAQRKSQHVSGEYNVADAQGSTTGVRGKYTEIIGNGTSASNRSNARTLDWDGNEVLAGGLTAGGDVSSSGNVSATGTLSSGGNATIGGDMTVSGGDLTLGSTPLSEAKLSSILAAKVKCTDANSDGNVVISFENFS